MSNFDSDGGAENPWDDRGDLAWNEFDWERYLRDQDEAVHRYLSFYEAFRNDPDRIDKVAEKMDWGDENWSDDAESDDDSITDDTDGAGAGEDDVYTLHKNPIFVATKAIYLGLNRSWQRLAGDSVRAPQSLALAMLQSLHQGEDHAVQAVHALDFGDFAMAISLFKRAMSALNGTLALLGSEQALRYRAVSDWREEALPRLFDLREIWLRVIAECREELDRPIDEEN